MKLRTGVLKDKQNKQNFLARSPRKKREDSNKIRNEREDVTTDITDIHSIIKDYYKNCTVNWTTRINGSIARKNKTYQN